MTTDNTPDTDTEQRALFSTWLAGYGAGHADDQLTAAMREVVGAVMLHDKGGTVSLKLSVSKAGDGVKVIADVTSKAPESKPGGQFFFVTPVTGDLTTRHPSQPVLPGM